MALAIKVVLGMTAQRVGKEAVDSIGHPGRKNKKAVRATGRARLGGCRQAAGGDFQFKRSQVPQAVEPSELAVSTISALVVSLSRFIMHTRPEGMKV